MNLETFQFIFFFLHYQRKRGRNINIGYSYLKELAVLLKLTVGALLIVNFVVRILLDYQQPNADQLIQADVHSICSKIVINQYVDCIVYFVSLVRFCLFMDTFLP